MKDRLSRHEEFLCWSVLEEEEEKGTLFLTDVDGAEDLAHQNNLAQFVRMISYCIRFGDHQILDKFVFDPIQEGTSRLKTEDLGAYAYALGKRMESLTHPKEQPYLKVLVQGLYRLYKPA